MVLWWNNHGEFDIKGNRGICNATSSSHDTVIQYRSELYNLARTFDMAFRLQILYFFCIYFSLYQLNYSQCCFLQICRSQVLLNICFLVFTILKVRLEFQQPGYLSLESCPRGILHKQLMQFLWQSQSEYSSFALQFLVFFGKSLKSSSGFIGKAGPLNHLSLVRNRCAEKPRDASSVELRLPGQCLH